MKTFRRLRTSAMSIIAAALSLTSQSQNMNVPSSRPNLAIVATASGSNRGGGGSLASLNDGLIPTNQNNFRGAGGNRQVQARSVYSVDYEWKQPVSTKEVAVYLWNYNNGLRLPEAYKIQYWDGSNFVPVKMPKALVWKITNIIQLLSMRLKLPNSACN